MSWDRLKLDERWNFALPGPEIPPDPDGESPREGDFCRPGGAVLEAQSKVEADK